MLRASTTAQAWWNGPLKWFHVAGVKPSIHILTAATCFGMFVSQTGHTLAPRWKNKYYTNTNTFHRGNLFLYKSTFLSSKLASHSQVVCFSSPPALPVDLYCHTTWKHRYKIIFTLILNFFLKFHTFDFLICCLIVSVVPLTQLRKTKIYIYYFQKPMTKNPLSKLHRQLSSCLTFTSGPYLWEGKCQHDSQGTRHAALNDCLH